MTSVIGRGLIVLALVATSVEASPKLAALAPGSSDDARAVIAIGPGGEVYEPDGHGAWARHRAIGVSITIVSAARGGAGVIASGGGAVFRLADNGWSAIRLAQHGVAVASAGRRAVAAIGREVFELDRGAAPTRLGQASGNVVAIAAGPGSVVLATDREVFRLDHGKLEPLAGVPGGTAVRLVSDHWALVDGAAFDLRADKPRAWPSGFTATVAAGGADGALVAVGPGPKGLELVVIHGTTVDRQPIGPRDAAVPVGVVVDASGRAVVALDDGRLLVRDRDAWSTVAVVDELPAHAPGSPPATSR